MILKRYYDDQGNMTEYDALINNEVQRVQMHEDVKASIELIKSKFGDHEECASEAAQDNLQDTRLFIDNFRGTL